MGATFKGQKNWKKIKEIEIDMEDRWEKKKKIVLWQLRERRVWAKVLSTAEEFTQYEDRDEVNDRMYLVT